MDTEHKMETKLVVDCITNTVKELELSEDELAQRLKDQDEQAQQDAQAAADKASAAAAKEAAQAKLAALGLTTDDLKALGLGNN
jgi:hypothetical protein